MQLTLIHIHSVTCLFCNLTSHFFFKFADVQFDVCFLVLYGLTLILYLPRAQDKREYLVIIRDKFCQFSTKSML